MKPRELVSVIWSHWEEDICHYREGGDVDEGEHNVVQAEWPSMEGGEVQDNDGGKKVEEYGGEANDNWENCGEVDGEIDNEDEDEKEGDEEGEDEETDDDNEYGLPPATAYMAVVADPGDHK